MLAENEIAAQIARQRMLQEIERRNMADSPASVDRDYRVAYEPADFPSSLIKRLAKSATFGVIVGSASLPGTLGLHSSYDVVQFPVNMQGGIGIFNTEAAQSPLERFLDEKIRDARAAAAELGRANPLFHNYAVRLRELIDLAREEYPETDIPAPASIAAFAKMLSAFSQLCAPSLSLLPSGAIWLSWKQAQRGSGGMAIFRDGTASFAMLLDNPERPTRPIHMNVSGDLKSVLAAMADAASSRWIGEFN